MQHNLAAPSPKYIACRHIPGQRDPPADRVEVWWNCPAEQGTGGQCCSPLWSRGFSSWTPHMDLLWIAFRFAGLFGFPLPVNMLPTLCSQTSCSLIYATWLTAKTPVAAQILTYILSLSLVSGLARKSRHIFIHLRSSLQCPVNKMHSAIPQALVLHNVALNVQCDMQHKYPRDSTAHCLPECWQVAAHSACTHSIKCTFQLDGLPCLWPV
jgi:hypothetical protein